jgi:transglutaminase-like putative cysteine protease
VAVAAVVFSLYSFFGGYLNAQLKAIANLLVYLQLILFFQDKNDRIYWHMILLSLLQVVVGAALDLGMVFGVLLGVYTFLSLTALILFFLHRESQATLPMHKPATMEEPSAGYHSPPILRGMAGSDLESHRSLSALGMRNALFIALGAILFALVYFRTSPRHPEANWAFYRGQRPTASGFTSELQLQRMGEMLQSNEPVMRVWLQNNKHEPLKRFEPYFAGEVLPYYDPIDVSWEVSQVRQSELEQIDQEGGKMIPAPAGSFYQMLHIRGSNQRAICAITPAYAVAGTPVETLRTDRNSHLLFRKLTSESYIFPDSKIALGTTGLVANYQPAISPAFQPQNQVERFRWAMQLEEATMNYDTERFAGLARVAEEWLETKLVDDSKPYAVAKSLEDHFHTPGLYRYSLNMNIARDNHLDPIEDFVVNHRIGHCQYFASALVMMLRSRGIPARMVVGYRGFEYNESFHYYQVQQRHAHAWVEAYLAPEHIPENEPTGGKIQSAGAWLRLEPTPSSEESAAEFARNWLGTARDWFDYFDFVWSDYVVGLNQAKQSSSAQNWLMPTAEEHAKWSWKEQWKQWAAWLGFHFSDGNGRIRFDWRAAITTMVFSAGLLFALHHGRKWLRYWGWTQTWNWRRRDRSQPQIAFYIRLEKILGRDGYQRRAEQTPREYSEHCGELVDEQTRQAIARVVATYYKIRFGEYRLAASEQQAIELELNRLEERMLKGEGANLAFSNE